MRVTLVDRLHARGGQCVDLVQCDDASHPLLVDKHTAMAAGADCDLAQAAWQELDLYLTLQTSMAQLKKPSAHLLTLQAYHLQQGRLHRFHEYCERGDLLELLQRDRRMAVAGFATELTKDTVRRLFTETLDAVATLHECGIAHLDLSLENILLTNDLHVRVGDLGNAERFAGTMEDHGLASVALQRPRSLAKHAYASPEMHSASLVDVTKADAWALGVILWTLWTKQPLLRTASLDDERFVLIKAKGTHAALSDFSSAFAQAPVVLKDLICRLLDVAPATRLSVREALRHPWLLQSYPKSVLLVQPRKSTSPVSSAPKRKTGKCRSESVGGEIALEKTRISIRPSSIITRARASSENQDSIQRHLIPSQ